MPVEFLSWRTAIAERVGDGKRLEKTESSWDVCYEDIGLERGLSLSKDIVQEVCESIVMRSLGQPRNAGP